MVGLCDSYKSLWIFFEAHEEISWSVNSRVRGAKVWRRDDQIDARH